MLQFTVYCHIFYQDSWRQNKMLCKGRNSSAFQVNIWCTYTPQKWIKSPCCAEKFWIIPISGWLSQVNCSVHFHLCLVQTSCFSLLRPSWRFRTVINKKGFCLFFMDFRCICMSSGKETKSKSLYKQFESENFRWLWEIHQ